MMDRKIEWAAPPGDYALPEDEVHVWRAGLDWSAGSIAALEEILSPDEREKADGFRFDMDRRRHVVGRSLLRRLLGRCLGTAPDRLRFDYSALGKPSLAVGTAQTPVRFNVSHSGEWVLVALTIGRAVGIDVERVRADMEVARIAEHFFSASERTALAALEAGAQSEAFFACWTRKEAYIKATGDGLSLPLDQFDVAFLPGQAARLLATRPDPAEARRWLLRDLDVGPGHKAALAVEGSGWQLKTWHWPRDQAETASAGARSTTGCGSFTRNQIT
jgi:4'-phosphopantetheinyl transferase